MAKNQNERIIDSPFTATARGGSTSSTSGTSGGVSAHALDDTGIHTGTLTWAQLSKTGSSLADLATRAHSNLTGVGANDHHDAATAGNTAIALTGQAISLFLNATASGLEISTGLRIADTIAGSGLSIASKVLAINLASPSGLDITTDALSVADSIAGAGLTIASKVLAVGAGDGIEVAADAIAVDLTATSGLEFSSGDLQLADSVAGAGLVIASKVLAVGAGDGVAVAADAVAVDLATNSGLTFSTAKLTLGTPGSATVSSSNAISTSTHTHAVTSSSNPGAAASILASTASGGLTLQSLAVQGSVDITNGGDLTVGSNVLFVDNSLASIGVNRAPDPQFDVDVAGALRAQYLVGSVAIQLDDVVLLSHFDGRGPFATNKLGEWNSIRGGVATVSDDGLGTAVRITYGKFGGALEIAGAYTNVVTNPQFDSGSTTGWSNHGTGTGTRAASLEQNREGLYSYKIVKTAGAATAAVGTTTDFSATDTLEYAASLWVYVTALDGGSQQLQIALVGTPFGSGTTTEYVFDDVDNPLDEWVQLRVKATASATGTAQLRFRIHNADTGTVYIDAAQVTQTAHIRPYYSGAKSSAGNLSYVGVPVNWRRMTWGAWVKLSDTASAGGSDRYIGSIAADASNNFQLYVRTTGNTVRFVVNDSTLITSTDTVSAMTWTHIMVTVGVIRDNDDSVLHTHGAALYIDGVYQDSQDIPTSPTGTPTVQIGDRRQTGLRLGGWIDDFVITANTEHPKRVRAIYESDAPVFAESSVFSFRTTPKGLVWADDEGLWMRNLAGETVLGAYGGETSKSWGGKTLDPSDVLIGDANRGAYMLWDDDAFALEIGRVASANANLRLTGTDLSFRVDTTERVSLTGAGILALKDGSGVTRISLNATTGISILGSDGMTERIGLASNALTIRDSDGDAVFTFSSGGGAEFTLPLTLGADGGIYQGSGSFASPTTGLKIWNSGGTGRIAGFASMVEQAGFATTGKFTAGAGAVSLERNGLFLTNGSAEVLGVYTGATTLSWGGVTLAPGDLLLGDTDRGGALLWDDSAGSLIVRNGATAVITLTTGGSSEFTGVMTIGASGEIRQGTGTVGSNFTGTRIWRDSSIGRIAGYNSASASPQWYAGTDGKLYAGGGNVLLDANGLALATGSGDSSAVVWRESGTLRSLVRYDHSDDILVLRSGATGSGINPAIDLIARADDGNEAKIQLDSSGQEIEFSIGGAQVMNIDAVGVVMQEKTFFYGDLYGYANLRIGTSTDTSLDGDIPAGTQGILFKANTDGGESPTEPTRTAVAYMSPTAAEGLYIKSSNFIKIDGRSGGQNVYLATAAGRVGVGPGALDPAPEAVMHVHDGIVGGWLPFFADAVAGTAVNIVAAGTYDVQYIANVLYTLRASDGTTATGSTTITPGAADVTLHTVTPDVLKLRCTSGGALQVLRTSGSTVTWKVNFLVQWL